MGKDVIYVSEVKPDAAGEKQDVRLTVIDQASLIAEVNAIAASTDTKLAKLKALVDTEEKRAAIFKAAGIRDDNTNMFRVAMYRDNNQAVISNGIEVGDKVILNKALRVPLENNMPAMEALITGLSAAAAKNQSPQTPQSNDFRVELDLPLGDRTGKIPQVPPVPVPSLNLSNLNVVGEDALALKAQMTLLQTEVKAKNPEAAPEVNADVQLNMVTKPQLVNFLLNVSREKGPDGDSPLQKQITETLNDPEKRKELVNRAGMAIGASADTRLFAYADNGQIVLFKGKQQGDKLILEESMRLGSPDSRDEAAKKILGGETFKPMPEKIELDMPKGSITTQQSPPGNYSNIKLTPEQAEQLKTRVFELAQVESLGAGIRLVLSEASGVSSAVSAPQAGGRNAGGNGQSMGTPDRDLSRLMNLQPKLS